ncbi:hypothetical protein, partial [Sutterella wadsworthensis]|uniref:hypothetical protein n=1 Tax=Sutterella wadsworthensis TaxID=40545 RepID=UPI00241CDECD
MELISSPNVINIGSGEHYVQNLNIEGRASQSGFGVITVGHNQNSQNQNVNIYAENAVLSLSDPNPALAFYTNTMLTTGTESKNCGIN